MRMERISSCRRLKSSCENAAARMSAWSTGLIYVVTAQSGSRQHVCVLDAATGKVLTNEVAQSSAQSTQSGGKTQTTAPAVSEPAASAPAGAKISDSRAAVQALIRATPEAAAYLPFEIYALWHHPDWLTWGVFVLNVVIVLVLARDLQRRRRARA